MKVSFLQIGKTDKNYLSEGIRIYLNRIKHYVDFEIYSLNEIKKFKPLDINSIKKNEAKEILKYIVKDDFVVLLDENGKEHSSVKFAEFINNKMVTGCKKLIFISGGPYGFSEEIYKRANELISLSKLTFSHQLVRLVFLEQLYRAFTIIRGEPYHHG
jgi:23S rRNA (pseudouridine1915-N3)-methyltransferase